jgi:phosphoenolpyruvate synthase/pyruvate phosphate dikinase
MSSPAANPFILNLDSPEATLEQAGGKGASLARMAAGIVTDVGGPLSHSSIVAREYGVPAVLGTGVATQRIRSGQSITVDGSGGVVTLSG